MKLPLIFLLILLTACKTAKEKEAGINAFSSYEGTWKIYEVIVDREELMPQKWVWEIKNGKFYVTVKHQGEAQVWVYGYEEDSNHYTGLFKSPDVTVKLKGKYDPGTRTFLFKGYDSNGHGMVAKYWREPDGRSYSFVTVSKDRELLFSRKQRNEKID